MLEIDIEYVKTIAQEAGAKALTMQQGMQSELKADGSYVTDIDRAIENYVRERLEQRYPDFAFLGEEFGRHGGDDQPLWAVDPIDGTTNMVFGLPQWGVSIGLIHEGKSVAGAFAMPRTQELFWAEAGRGAWRNGVRLQAKDRDSIHLEDTLGFTSAAIKHLDVSTLPGRIRCMGSIAADISYAASGTFCCLVGMREGAYDIAAAMCCALEAGCVAEYLTGEPLDMAAIVRDSRTLAPFVVAPPKMAALLQRILAPTFHEAEA